MASCGQPDANDLSLSRYVSRVALLARIFAHGIRLHSVFVSCIAAHDVVRDQKLFPCSHARVLSGRRCQPEFLG
jgi:hypothetical protein